MTHQDASKIHAGIGLFILIAAVLIAVKSPETNGTTIVGGLGVILILQAIAEARVSKRAKLQA